MLVFQVQADMPSFYVDAGWCEIFPLYAVNMIEKLIKKTDLAQ